MHFVVEKSLQVQSCYKRWSIRVWYEVCTNILPSFLLLIGITW